MKHFCSFQIAKTDDKHYVLYYKTMHSSEEIVEVYNSKQFRELSNRITSILFDCNEDEETPPNE